MGDWGVEGAADGGRVGMTVEKAAVVATAVVMHVGHTAGALLPVEVYQGGGTV